MTPSADLIARYSHFVFDLDDTMIHEADYLYAAYYEISVSLSADAHTRDLMYSFLKDGFESGGRSGLFDSFLARFQMSPGLLQNMLTILRSVRVPGGLKLSNQSTALLRLLHQHDKAYHVITNGNPGQQENKIRQIHWEDYPRPQRVIYANQYAPKPSVASFHALQLQYPPKDILFIGDSQTDREFAKNAGIGYQDIKNIFPSAR